MLQPSECTQSVYHSNNRDPFCISTSMGKQLFLEIAESNTGDVLFAKASISASEHGCRRSLASARMPRSLLRGASLPEGYGWAVILPIEGILRQSPPSRPHASRRGEEMRTGVCILSRAGASGRSIEHSSALIPRGHSHSYPH